MPLYVLGRAITGKGYTKGVPNTSCTEEGAKDTAPSGRLNLAPSCKNLVQLLSARTFHLVLTIPSLQLFCFWNIDALFAGNRPYEGSARKGDDPYFIWIVVFGAHQGYFRRSASNIQHERAFACLNPFAEISC